MNDGFIFLLVYTFQNGQLGTKTMKFIPAKSPLKKKFFQVEQKGSWKTLFNKSLQICELIFIYKIVKAQHGEKEGWNFLPHIGLKDVFEKLKLEQQRKAFLRRHNEQRNPMVQGGEDAAVKEKREYIKSVRK